MLGLRGGDGGPLSVLHAAAQGPSNATVQQASASVFRVLSTRCAGGSTKDRFGTGFAVTIDNQPTLVTAPSTWSPDARRSPRS